VDAARVGDCLDFNMQAAGAWRGSFRRW
jgi:hypothetical protein